MKTRTSLIGFFAYAYPENVMKTKIEETVKALESKGVDVNYIGYVIDHDENSIDQAKKKLEETCGNSSSIILVISGWTESPPIFRVIADFLHLPILLWCLSGYHTHAGLISPAAAAGASGLNLPLKIFGAKHVSIYENVGEELNINEAYSFVKFADSLQKFRSMRIASIGYADMNLYSLMYDGVIIKKYTGIHVDNIDFIDIKFLMDKIKNDDKEKFIEDFKKEVCFVTPPTQSDLEMLARTCLAINQTIEEKDYKAITLKCVLGMSKLFNYSPCMIKSVIGNKVETICECDIYGLLAQVIIKELTNTKSIFLEFYEFYKNSVLMGACGFAPFCLCDEEQVKVQGHDWGDAGGLMNVSKLKTGKVTLVKLYVVNGQMHMHLLTGNARTPEKWQEDGWEGKGPIMPSLDIEIDGDMEDFQDNLAGQHYIIAYGDITKIMKRYCKFTGIRFNEHDKIDFDYK